MIQKVIQVGNSLALTIPKSFIDKTGYKAGDEVFVHQEPKSKSLIITSKENGEKMRDLDGKSKEDEGRCVHLNFGTLLLQF